MPTEIDPSQGFCLEIAVLPDGTFNVSVEPLQAEMGEEQPGEGAGQQASSIEEALQVAQDLYQQNAGGSGGSGGSGLPDNGGKPVDMAQMWQEEAAKKGPLGATGGM